MSTLSDVTGFLTGRKDEISTAKYLTSLLTDASDYTSAKYIEQLSELLPESTPSEAKMAVSTLSNIVAKINEDIPERVLGKGFGEDVPFSQLLGMSQQLFMSPKVAENMEGIIAHAKNEMSTEVDNISADLDGLEDDINRFAADFNAIVDGKRPTPTLDKIQSAAPEMVKLIQEAKSKTAQLQARTSRGLGISDFRINDLLGSLNKIKEQIPTQGMELSYMATASGLLGKSQEIRGNIEELDSWRQRLKDFVPQSIQNILPGDIFDKNFSKIYEMLDSSAITSKLAGISAGDPSRILSSLGGVSSNVTAISGLISSFGNAQMLEKLSDVENEANQRINSFAESLNSVTAPIESMLKSEYAVKSMIKTAERYALGTLQKEVAPIISKLQSDAVGYIGVAKEKLGQVKTILNMFDPPVNTNVTAYISAIGKIAPNARDSLISGQLNNFKKTLESPAFLTKAGAAVSSLNNFVQANKDKLTVPDKNMVSIVTNYLSGEHKRAMMSIWIANTAGQRSAALTSLDTFVKDFINPIELMVNTLSKKMGDV